MLIDSVVIEVKGGKGGSGRVNFRRETHVPRGGPAGGDGGAGGSVYLIGAEDLHMLQNFRYRRAFQAGDGVDGGPKNMHGSDGDSLEVPVPLGTEAWEVLDGEDTSKLAEITVAGQRVLIAAGGRGGWGNARFANSVNQAPLLAEAGEDGERHSIRLNLKLLADVGIVGMPNAGKSSLLTGISAARPKVADYPFTTLEPVLGVVYSGTDRFIAVDIPGLIEGAHEGAGLGTEFLKHIERTRVLVHLVDGSAEDPAGNVTTILRELEQSAGGLSGKPQLLVVNKLDLPAVQEGRKAIAAAIKKRVPGQDVLFISAATHEGLPKLSPASSGLEPLKNQ